MKKIFLTLLVLMIVFGNTVLAEKREFTSVGKETKVSHDSLKVNDNLKIIDSTFSYFKIYKEGEYFIALKKGFKYFYKTGDDINQFGQISDSIFLVRERISLIGLLPNQLTDICQDEIDLLVRGKVVLRKAHDTSFDWFAEFPINQYSFEKDKPLRESIISVTNETFGVVIFFHLLFFGFFLFLYLAYSPVKYSNKYGKNLNRGTYIFACIFLLIIIFLFGWDDNYSIFTFFNIINLSVAIFFLVLLLIIKIFVAKKKNSKNKIKGRKE